MEDEILTNQTTAFGVYRVLIPKYLVKSFLFGLVEIMNPDVTPNCMLKDVSVSPKREKEEKRYKNI